MKKRKLMPRDYSPGHFTELIRAHNWPPRFEPMADMNSGEFYRAQAASAAREQAKAEGKGWGAGTIVLPGTPKHAAPEMMR